MGLQQPTRWYLRDYFEMVSQNIAGVFFVGSEEHVTTNSIPPWTLSAEVG